MSDSIEKFLSVQLDAPAHWRSLVMSDYPSPLDERMPDALVPLHGTPFFEKLTAAEKQALAVEFIRLNAEALIILEQVLLVGMRKHERNLGEGGLRRATRKLAREEYYHIRGFRQFLAQEKRFRWRERDLFLFRNKRCRRWLAALAMWQPTALCLPGAKVEAYSLGYSQYIKESFGGWEKNRWTKVQHLHFMDEAFHVSVQFEMYSSAYIRGWAAVKLALGMVALILILQVLLICGNWRIMRAAMPDRGFFARVAWTLRMARWIVRTYPPYAEARAKMKRLLGRPGLPMGRLFSFMAW